VSAVEQLPRGRHGLDPAEVRAVQRDRIVTSMVASIAERGYVETTVADVISGARVSRETFYEQFANKEDAFLAAFDYCTAELAARIETAGTGDADPVTRLEGAIDTYLETLRAEPALARTFLIDVYAAGPAAVERRTQVMSAFVDLVAGILEPADAEGRFACEAIVGAISSMVTMRVANSDYDELPRLGPPLIALARRLLTEAE
jgi:AcrR family transcriptional regulator